MDYTEVRQTIARAWGAFENQLRVGGFTHDQVTDFVQLLDMKDGYGKVEDAAVEATR
jgi:hypothetical protein